MTLSEFQAEIYTDFDNYVDDINELSVKTWVIERLRKLGLSILETNEAILDIDNSRTQLPEDFNTLKLALRLDPIGCDSPRERESMPYIYYKRIENPAYWNEITGEYITNCDTKIVTEEISINNRPFNFYYNHRYLSLVKGIDKKNIAVDCLNLHPSIRNSYPDQINISGSNLNCNFKSGQIYIKYYALPTIDGEIIIPEYTTGDILEYIKKYVKSQIAENLIANNKNPQGLGQLYPMWIQELPALKAAAQREAKFNALPKDWHKKYKAVNQRESAKFNIRY